MTSRRRRLAGVVAAVALVAGLVFAGTIAAQAIDGLFVTTDTAVDEGVPYPIAGTADDANTADIDVHLGPDATGAILCTAPYAAAWECDTTLPPGTYQITARQDGAGGLERVDTKTITVYPPEPTWGQPEPYSVVDGQTANLLGQVTVDVATVYVEIDGAPACTTPGYNAGDTWTCDWDTGLLAGPGDYTVTVAQEVNGVFGADLVRTLRVTSPPVLEVLTPADGSTAPWSSAFEISGTAPATTPPVSVEVDGVALAECAAVAVAGDGSWLCTTEVPVGEDHTVQAFQGAPGSAVNTFDVTYPDPQVDTPAANSGFIHEDSSAEYSGVATYPGVTVNVVSSSGGSCIIDTVLDLGDPWECPIPTGTATPGSYDVTVTQYLGPVADGNPIGASWSGSLELSAGVTITSPAADDVVDWSPDGIVVSGTSPSSATPVTVYLDGEFSLCTDTTPSPTWSCTADIAPGSYFIVAQQDGYPDATVDFDVLLPPPLIDATAYSFPRGTESALFSGPSLYPGADVLVELEVGDGVTRDCTGFDDGEEWSCSIAIDDLPTGEYTAYVSQSTEVSDSNSFPVDVEIILLTPSLDCTFRPNGGVSASSTIPLDALYADRIIASGGGSSGGGSPGFDEFGEQGACGSSLGLPFTSGEFYQYENLPGCSVAECDLDGLAPGDYGFYYLVADSEPGYSYESHHFLFRIPEAPTISTSASTANSVILTGSGVVGDTIRVVSGAGTALCTATVEESGTWGCTFPRSSASSARAIDIDALSGGMSAYSAPRSIAVLEPPPAPPAEPTTPSAPEPDLVQWFLTFEGDLMNLRPGDSFTINVSGMPPGTTIEVWMHSTPRLLGTSVATGAPMAMELVVPADVENGEHEIEMIAVTPLGTQYFFTSDAVVTGGVDPAPVDDPSTPEDEATGEEPAGTGGSGAGTADRGDPAAPSALTESIATLERIVANPLSIAVAGGLAISLLFLVALPTELLNNSLSSNTNRLGRAYGAVDRAFTRLQDWFIRVTRTRVIAAILLTTIVALIYGFVDPRFGFDLVSLRLVLSLGLAFFILSYGASWLSGFVTRRLWGVQNTIVLQPSIILFAVLGVVLARLLDFSPGFLVGIAIGLELVAASKRVVARAVLVQFAFVVGLALLAWVGYSLFVPGDDFVGMLTEDMLVAVTAEGLTGAMIAIFPLRFLDGRDIWDDSKPLWVAAFVVVATAFALLVLPTALEGSDVGDYGVWVLVFTAFGAIAVLVWFFFVRAAQAEERAEREKVDA